ncbi:MAG: hypothetical protein HYR55_16785 [Acidobacteria bacterium]|nr:hypothetical protein [Acidobacteriota bacterium]MBI3654946.1 hypothetical protein [Acidobacteriota bacterium]
MKIRCAMLRLMRSGLSISICFIIFGSPVRGSDWKEKLAYAESQHEITMTLIDEGKYDEARTELRKIIDLQFPEKYEDRLAKEIFMVCDKLRHKGKDNLALEVLDEGLEAVRLKRNKARLYKEKGYIYSKQGNHAMKKEMFRKAAELELK